METELTAEVALRKDTNYVYSSQCLASVLRCLPQDLCHCLTGEWESSLGGAGSSTCSEPIPWDTSPPWASLPGAFCPVLSLESSKALF